MRHRGQSLLSTVALFIESVIRAQYRDRLVRKESTQCLANCDICTASREGPVCGSKVHRFVARLTCVKLACEARTRGRSSRKLFSRVTDRDGPCPLAVHSRHSTAMLYTRRFHTDVRCAHGERDLSLTLFTRREKKRRRSMEWSK